MSDPEIPKNPKPKTPPEKRMPGRRGGWLKSGNTIDVGRKPTAEVRGKLLHTVDEATDLIYEILEGKFKEEVRNRTGVVVGHRPATIKEIAAIYRCLCGHALPTQRQSIAPVDERYLQADAEQAERVREAEAMDALTEEEFAWARRIAEKMDAHQISWEGSSSQQNFRKDYDRKRR